MGITEYKLNCETDAPKTLIKRLPDFNGAQVYNLRFIFEEKKIPEKLTFSFLEESKNCFSFWTPFHSFSRGIYPSWIDEKKCESKADFGAPVFQYLDKQANNILTVALSDCYLPLTIHGGIDERSGKILVKIDFFTEITKAITEYEINVYLDNTKMPYYDALKNVRSFWDSVGYSYLEDNETARRRTYSSWYSFQKNVSEKAVFEQCKLASNLGMKTLILDDGWQTPCNGGGDQWIAFNTCGDWEPNKEKFPDFRGFVESIHSLGMKFMLWIGLPFIGEESKDFDLFKGMLLDYNPENAHMFKADPRFKSVRDWYVNKLLHLMSAYNLDGFKLDFIDHFHIYGDMSSTDYDSMDCPYLQKAVCLLLEEIEDELKKLKEDIMIEFRLPYFGPCMLQYTNILRIDDRAYGAMYNRVIGIDMRLLTEKTSVQSDMLMWDYDADVEAAADQLSSLLFLVPQISMLLDKLNDEHYKMLKFYLDFIDDNRDVLQYGKLVPMYPEAMYGAVYAQKNGTVIAGLYSVNSFDVPPCTKNLKLCNASGTEKVFVDFSDTELVGKNYVIINCMGEKVEEGTINSTLCKFTVPHNGFIFVG